MNLYRSGCLNLLLLVACQTLLAQDLIILHPNSKYAQLTTISDTIRCNITRMDKDSTVHFHMHGPTDPFGGSLIRQNYLTIHYNFFQNLAERHKPYGSTGMLYEDISFTSLPLDLVTADLFDPDDDQSMKELTHFLTIGFGVKAFLYPLKTSRIYRNNFPIDWALGVNFYFGSTHLTSTSFKGQLPSDNSEDSIININQFQIDLERKIRVLEGNFAFRIKSSHPTTISFKPGVIFNETLGTVDGRSFQTKSTFSSMGIRVEQDLFALGKGHLLSIFMQPSIVTQDRGSRDFDKKQSGTVYFTPRTSGSWSMGCTVSFL